MKKVVEYVGVHITHTITWDDTVAAQVSKYISSQETPHPYYNSTMYASYHKSNTGSTMESQYHPLELGENHGTHSGMIMIH